MSDILTDSSSVGFFELDIIERASTVADYIASEFNTKSKLTVLIQQLQNAGLSNDWHFMSNVTDTDNRDSNYNCIYNIAASIVFNSNEIFRIKFRDEFMRKVSLWYALSAQTSSSSSVQEDTKGAILNKKILNGCLNQLLNAISAQQQSLNVFRNHILNSTDIASALAASALLVREQQAMRDLETQYAIINDILNCK